MKIIVKYEPNYNSTGCYYYNGKWYPEYHITIWNKK